MSKVRNMVEWCLKKAKAEMEKGETHRGIIKKVSKGNNYWITQQKLWRTTITIKIDIFRRIIMCPIIITFN